MFDSNAVSEEEWCEWMICTVRRDRAGFDAICALSSLRICRVRYVLPEHGSPVTIMSYETVSMRRIQTRVGLYILASRMSIREFFGRMLSGTLRKIIGGVVVKWGILPRECVTFTGDVLLTIYI